MAEPLSFVASVIAISTLAGTVATKGYRYIKAVKDCRDDVPKLIAEVNVLCGILERLVVLLGGTRARYDELKEGVPHEPSLQHEHVEDEESGASSDCDDQLGPTSEALQTPEFIYECQKTLLEIEGVLNKFRPKNIKSSQSTNEGPRHAFSKLRGFTNNDLKWPLSRSKMMQLFEALERHKSTCTIALAKDGLVGIHAVLEQTTITNKHLAELRAKQEKMLEICITQAQEKALAWLSPVNPAWKLQNFRQERQRGTGTWLFDLPEMIEWLETPDAALWIYGIPGAGKTILSTLVVDEVLNRKRSETIGTAYFYIRHDDKDSHKPRNVIGSLVAQLARQNHSALADIVQLHAQHDDHSSLATAPEEQELTEQLIDLTRHFTNTYIVIDGLDECGPAFDADRKRLIDFVAEIHNCHNKTIRTLVFSRDDFDIRQRLTGIEYRVVSIAATSADLRLYTTAWLPSLHIQSESLKIEIVDALVNQANGMFMWVRAQVDYLQRLPHDMEKRKALKKLPPDLPKTYIRILEAIDSTFPALTKMYIQRILKWLVLQITKPARFFILAYPLLTAGALCQAICIENETDWPSAVNTPTLDQIMHWLGCIIRVDKHTKIVHLSHFTIKEFLTMDAELITDPVVRKYLVDPKDEEYIANVCLAYSMHNHFKDEVSLASDNMPDFISEHPLWRYIAPALCDHVSSLDGAGVEDDRPLRRFLSMPACRGFEVWSICHIWLDQLYNKYANADPDDVDEDPEKLEEDPDNMRRLSSTLHFAVLGGLTNQTQKLLEDGADPNASIAWAAWAAWAASGATPLHLAICDGRDFPGIYNVYLLFCENDDTQDVQRILQMSKILIELGADVDRQITVRVDGKLTRVTPLVLAVMYGIWEVASLLLVAGANWNATADEKIDKYDELEKCDDWCSIKKVLEEAPLSEHIVQRAVEVSRHDGLTNCLNEWRFLQVYTRPNSGSSSPTTNNSTNYQGAFIVAFTERNWQKVEEVIKQHSSLKVNCLNERGYGAIHYAAECEEGALVLLLEHGADPNLLQYQGATALCIAVEVGGIKKINILLNHGADMEVRASGGATPLLLAVRHGQLEALQLLLDAGADINATQDDGIGALHLAIENHDTAMFTSLLERGINSHLSDHYGSNPLHVACFHGLEYEVEQLIKQMTKPGLCLDDHSLVIGTTLYVASRRGYDRIATRLLDHGAAIDKIGPGNLLGSALMAACAEGHGVAVELLLSRGAALEVEGSRFGSAIETARVFRKEHIVKILEEHAQSPIEEETNGSDDGTGAKPPGEEDDSKETQHEDAEQKVSHFAQSHPRLKRIVNDVADEYGKQFRTSKPE